FGVAYKNSRVYIPQPDPVNGVHLAQTKRGRRASMITGEHPFWAVEVMQELIGARGGHTLVLSATANAGKLYAERLRTHAAGRWNVISQWEGMSRQQVTDLWRNDPTSVLVGTRSFMTGLDAP